MPHLEQWFVENKHFLRGTVSGHPFINDGAKIHTPLVIGRIGEKVKVISGMFYTLGIPHPTQGLRLPDANTTFLASLTDLGDQTRGLDKTR